MIPTQHAKNSESFTYRSCPKEICDIERAVIQEHHILNWLTTSDVFFCFKSVLPKKRYYEAKTVPELWSLFVQPRYIIIIAESRWIDLSDESKKALIFEALLCLDMDEDGKPAISDQSITLNPASITKYGAWNPNLLADLRQLSETGYQQELEQLRIELEEPVAI